MKKKDLGVLYNITRYKKPLLKNICQRHIFIDDGIHLLMCLEMYFLVNIYGSSLLQNIQRMYNGMISIIFHFLFMIGKMF